MPEHGAQRPPDGPRVRSGFRVATPDPPAGGACVVVWSVEALTSDLHLLTGTDRGGGRPAHVGLRAVLDGVELPDPATAPALGGPSGVVVVRPGEPYELRLLVNRFARLERARELVEPGASGTLVLSCRRALPLAARPGEAFALSGAPEVTAELRVTVHHDEEALEAEIAALVEVLRGRWREATSNELETALDTLVALRLPESRTALAGLTDHPNPLVRQEADRAAAR
ncbi:hypothetical protein [Saccharothrix sp. Mg75]|uniref:hypothetical protein n=1 Tax=Saccharothrix sp. Mg75 TaxID=3445357 RepID=UPI003EEAB88B